MTTERTLHILLVDDEEIVCQTIGDYLRDLRHHVDEAGDGLAALKLIETNDYDLVLLDVQMPGLDGISLLGRAQEIHPELSVVMITGHGTMEMAIQALRLGAADFLTKPIKLLELKAVLEKAIRIRALRRDTRRLRDTIRGLQVSNDVRTGHRTLVGISSATQKVREQIRQVVEAGCETILITGETGTGKEVVARELHCRSSPEDSPFIAVSCPALPESLVESELFGHVKGAFTGAGADRAGYFELADGGTLFLDEIADLSTSVQAKFLRVLETRMLRRVGGSKEVEVTLRVIAASNAPLEELVEAGRFRRDLLYRLNIYAIHLFPLRERREDILPLAEHFLATCARSRGLRFDGFSPEAEQVLLRYDFPGNARELRNLIERAVILCRSGRIGADHLTVRQVSTGDEGHTTSGSRPEVNRERAHLLRALEDVRWNRREAARTLGMPYSTLRRKMKQLGIA